MLAGLHPERAGDLRLDGEPLPLQSRRRTREQRRRIQLIPQDPLSSLNPRRTVGDTVARPMALHRLVPAPARAAAVATLLDAMELPAGTARRRPGELSGGQRQRVAIARALAAEPDVLICDEITSALDPATAEAVLQCLDRLRVERMLALVVISHDLGMVRAWCDDAVVLHGGRVVDAGPVDRVITSTR